MASLDVRDELDCSICLSIYKDPVTLQCGHNFCKVCITVSLEKQKESKQVYSCPECREEFKEKPALLRNVTLRNIAERFVSTQPPVVEGKVVFCTYCDSSVPAVKTCLLCEASLCSKHLKKHRNSPDHVLVDPTMSLEKRKCPIHKEVLKFYCTVDSVCICMTCRLDGNHQGHEVESLDKTSEKKKQELRDLLKNMTSNRTKTEQTIQKLCPLIKPIQDKAAGKTKRVTAIFQDLRTRLDDLESSVLTRISNQEKQTTRFILFLIKKLEVKMDELSKEMQSIEELCASYDALTVIQESNRKEMYDIGKKDHKMEEEYKEILRAGERQDETVIIETLHAKLSDLVTTAKKDIFTPSRSYQLDGCTAATSLRLSPDGKVARWIKPDKNSIVLSPRKFQNYSQVLSTICFSSGRNFWETAMSDCGDWRFGVCYDTIDRRGDSSYLGCNDKSWCLAKSSNNQYSIIHDRQEMLISQDIRCNRFRVCLDYEGGEVSFYELCSPIRHLHTFTAKFTKPLYAAFYVFGPHALVKIIT